MNIPVGAKTQEEQEQNEGPDSSAADSTSLAFDETQLATMSSTDLDNLAKAPAKSETDQEAEEGDDEPAGDEDDAPNGTEEADDDEEEEGEEGEVEKAPADVAKPNAETDPKKSKPKKFRVNENSVADGDAYDIALMVKGKQKGRDIFDALKAKYEPTAPAPADTAPEEKPVAPVSLDEHPQVKEAVAKMAAAEKALDDAQAEWDPSKISAATKAFTRAELDVRDTKAGIISEQKRATALNADRQKSSKRALDLYPDASNVDHPFHDVVVSRYTEALKDPARANDPDLPYQVMEEAAKRFEAKGFSLTKSGAPPAKPAAVEKPAETAKPKQTKSPVFTGKNRTAPATKESPDDAFLADMAKAAGQSFVDEYMRPAQSRA